MQNVHSNNRARSPVREVMQSLRISPLRQRSVSPVGFGNNVSLVNDNRTDLGYDDGMLAARVARDLARRRQSLSPAISRSSLPLNAVGVGRVDGDTVAMDMLLPKRHTINRDTVGSILDAQIDKWALHPKTVPEDPTGGIFNKSDLKGLTDRIRSVKTSARNKPPSTTSEATHATDGDLVSAPAPAPAETEEPTTQGTAIPVSSAVDKTQVFKLSQPPRNPLSPIPNLSIPSSATNLWSDVPKPSSNRRLSPKPKDSSGFTMALPPPPRAPLIRQSESPSTNMLGLGGGRIRMSPSPTKNQKKFIPMSKQQQKDHHKELLSAATVANTPAALSTPAKTPSGLTTPGGPPPVVITSGQFNSPTKQTYPTVGYPESDISLNVHFHDPNQTLSVPTFADDSSFRDELGTSPKRQRWAEERLLQLEKKRQAMGKPRAAAPHSQPLNNTSFQHGIASSYPSTYTPICHPNDSAPVFADWIGAPMHYTEGRIFHNGGNTRHGNSSFNNSTVQAVPAPPSPRTGQHRTLEEPASPSTKLVVVQTPIGEDRLSMQRRAKPSKHMTTVPRMSQLERDMMEDVYPMQADPDAPGYYLEPQNDDEPIVPLQQQFFHQRKKYEWIQHPAAPIIIDLMYMRGVEYGRTVQDDQLIESYMKPELLDTLKWMMSGVYFLKYGRDGSANERFFFIKSGVDRRTQRNIPQLCYAAKPTSAHLKDAVCFINYIFCVV